MNNLDLKVIEAIKLIAESTTDKVSYNVYNSIEKPVFGKGGSNKTVINIEIKHN